MSNTQEAIRNLNDLEEFYHTGDVGKFLNSRKEEFYTDKKDNENMFEWFIRKTKEALLESATKTVDKSEPESGEFSNKIKAFINLYKNEIPRRAEISFLIKAVKEIDNLRAEIEDWRNKEGSVCPEDFGFVEYIKQLKAELESDDWQKQATEFYGNGGCPICFESDEAGCKKGCYLGQLQAENKDLKDKIAKGFNKAAEKLLEKLQAANRNLKEKLEAAELEIKRTKAALAIAKDYVEHESTRTSIGQIYDIEQALKGQDETNNS